MTAPSQPAAAPAPPDPPPVTPAEEIAAAITSSRTSPLARMVALVAVLVISGGIAIPQVAGRPAGPPVEQRLDTVEAQLSRDAAAIARLQAGQDSLSRGQGEVVAILRYLACRAEAEDRRVDPAACRERMADPLDYVRPNGRAAVPP